MALNTFGGTPADVVTDTAGNVVALDGGGSPIELTVYTSAARTTQVTALFAMDGTTPLPGYVVPVNDPGGPNHGRLRFKASDAYPALWLWDGNPASDSWLIWARETPGYILGLSSGVDAANVAASAALAAAAALTTTVGTKPSRSELPISARSTTVVGNGVADDAPALQSALTGGNVDLYIPAGQYRIRATLRVYANTTITMHPNAVILNDSITAEYAFTNGEVGNATFATGYAGAGNITIRGGAIDNGPRRTAGLSTEAIGFAHAENILIENVRFLNNRASHFVELNSVRHGVIRGCTFTDMDSAGFGDRECINIDSATAAGFPGFGAYDNTPCDDILIENNTFDTAQAGVGSHSPTGGHTAIKVRKNTFRNITVDATMGAAVHGRGWLSGEVTGNRIKSVTEHAVYLQDCSNVTVRDNDISDVGLEGDGLHAAVYIDGGAGNSAGPNVIGYTGGVRYRVAYDVQSGAGHSVDEAGAVKGSAGFTENTGTSTKVNGTYTLNLADDTAVGLPIPGTSVQGLVAIGGHSTATHSPRGLYWVRGDAGPSVASVAAIAAANVTLTSGVLTGTTGTDGNVTISAANDGKLYIENRAGLARVIDVSFLNA